METQKLLKPAGKIVIVSDYREKEVIEHLKKLGAVVNEQALEVGDFIASDRICIERKSVLSDTPIIANIDGKIIINTIEDIYSKFKNESKIKVMGFDLKSKKIDWFNVYSMTTHKSKIYGISFVPRIKKKIQA